MKQTVLHIFAITLPFSQNLAHGYEPATHEAMSETAVNVSNLAEEAGTLKALGLKPLTAGQKFPNSEEVPLSIIKLIRYGAFMEDDGFIRPLNHFYDPVNDIGVNILGLPIAEPNPDWALKTDRLHHPEQQEYSLKDAYEYLFQALTLPDAPTRQQNFGLLFQSLGQVLHCLQDMAQPQHTRNDAHLALNDNDINDLVIEQPSHYEYYTLDHPATLSYTGYVPVILTQPYDYWHSAHQQGLADYSNRGFVSPDTNFGANPYPHPLYDPYKDVTTVDIKEAYQELGEPVPKAVLNGIETELKGSIDFIGSEVADDYTGISTYNPRTSSLSIFDWDLAHYNVEVVYTNPPFGESEPTIAFRTRHLFTLNRFNFDAANKLLIPRAVGYSAGLLNYFFRGQLAISPPAEGVYAIVDHATVKQRDEGFNRVKLKLKNTTPPLHDLVQDLNGGKLVVVAKYHRNPCYAPDLSGEFNNQHRHWNNCQALDTNEYITVSAEQQAILHAGEEKLFTFDFNQVIPLNAIDLVLQVVYKGPVGKDEAVVVATQDIAEPTYFSVINLTDYFAIDGIYYSIETILGNDSLLARLEKNNRPGYQPLAGDVIIEPSDASNLQFQTGLVTVSVLKSGTYFRLALLVNQHFDFHYSFSWLGGQYEDTLSLPGKEDTPDEYGSTYKLRDSYQFNFLYLLRQPVGATPTSFSKMGALKSPSPLPVTIKF